MFTERDAHDMAAEFPKFKLLRVKDVKKAPHNPPSRTAEKALKKLRASMAEVGLIYPVLVDSHNQLIDGHRRLAAAESLGWETIPAIVAKEGLSSGRVYAEVNEVSRRTSGNDSLTSWLTDQQSVSPARAKLFGEAKAKLGVGLMQRLAGAGLSVRVYQTAKRMERYCGCDAKKAVRWLIDTATIGQVMKAMEAGYSARKIALAVEADKTLTAENA